MVLLLLARGAGLRGLMGLGLATILHSACEIVGILVLTDSDGEPAWMAEAFLNTVASAAPLALLPSGAGKQFGPLRGGGIFVVTAGVVLWVMTLRPDYPLGAVVGLDALAALAGLIGARWLWCEGSGRSKWLAVGVAVAFSPVFASSGLLAETLGWSRRWLSASPVGTLAALWQLGVLGLPAPHGVPGRRRVWIGRRFPLKPQGDLAFGGMAGLGGASGGNRRSGRSMPIYRGARCAQPLLPPHAGPRRVGRPP
ncbi:MAG: hypothetical protein H7343_13840 [Undibacterium sp.]|nr:hypothetical protein [Opitutaceae bacterium]